ncbi:MAG TPA: sigma-54 dependent transcriptional regulator [Candidatus Methylomirabilis sp.]
MSAPAILVVDDDAASRALAAEILESHGHAVAAVPDGSAALDRLAAYPCDLILADMRMPGLDGMGLLQALARNGRHPPVIIATAYATIEHAVEAVKAGAYGYITKPFRPDHLARLVAKALEEEWLRRENDLLRRELHGRWRLENLIGRSPAMRALYRMVGVAAEAEGAVLLLGESGTGKEVVARAIHARSARRGGPFVAVNCAGIPEGLLESELFGHVRGAFTGAVREKAGLFQAAEGGTLFLDEVGDAPPSLQAKLLRALETREVRPVGGTQAERVDVRVIAATHADLPEAIRAGRFREDLYYRLNVIPIELPPLAGRREDIPLLAQHFLERTNARQRRDVRAIAPEALQRLLEHAWPGNVRELENAIERAVALAEGDAIRPEHLPPHVRDAPPPPAAGTLADLIAHAMQRALTETGGNRRAAARLLGIPERTFYRKLKALGLSPPAPPARRNGTGC